MRKFGKQIDLNLLDFNQPLPLVRQQMIDFVVQMPDFKYGILHFGLHSKGNFLSFYIMLGGNHCTGVDFHVIDSLYIVAKVFCLFLQFVRKPVVSRGVN